jgi:CRP/FNR family transcriptional regulator, cyclic AMP receptor protein
MSVGDFGPEQLRLLRKNGREQTWERGRVLMRQGETADRALLLEGGLVKVTADVRVGYTGVLAFRGAGELVGELGCVDRRPRSATVVVMREAWGVAVTAERFVQLLEREPSLASQVLRSVSLRQRDSDERRLRMAALTTEARLVAELLDLVVRHGRPMGGRRADPCRVVEVTQQELASACGVSRESAVRTLRVLRREGLVERGRGEMRVPSLTRLAERARRMERDGADGA